MKKWMLLFTVTITSSLAMAQLAGTKWKGTIKGDNPRNVFLDFKNNTCSLITISDSSLVESMLYSVESKNLSFTKIEGQSDCDNTTIGKYSFMMKKDSMFMKKVSDACDDRSSALDNVKWVKWIGQPRVKVDPSILSKYTGTYESTTQKQINILLDKGELYMESASIGLPKSILIPESKTIFLLKIAGVRVEFASDNTGKVIKMISHEDTDAELKKIK